MQVVKLEKIARFGNIQESKFVLKMSICKNFERKGNVLSGVI